MDITLHYLDYFLLSHGIAFPQCNITVMKFFALHIPNITLCNLRFKTILEHLKCGSLVILN